MQLFVQYTEYTESLHDALRSSLIERAQAWLINAAQRHYPLCTVELRCDGLPEQAAAPFRAWCVTQHIDLHLGAPYAHHHQSQVEKSHSTVQNYARSQRLRTDHWSYSNLHATQVKNVIVTARTIRDFKPTTTIPRPLTPQES